MSKKIVILSALLVVSLLIIPLAGCAKELTLTVWEPQDGSTFTDSPVAICGTVSDSKATVTINDGVIWVDKRGGFSTTVEPFEGENAINIVASRGKKVATHYIAITYSPEKIMSVEITSPDDKAEVAESPVTVSGKVSDPAAKVVVSGVEAGVAEDGTFSASIELSEGENTIEIVATMEGKEPVTETITIAYKPA